VLASASGDGTVKLWDAHSGQLKQTLKGHSSEVFSGVFSGVTAVAYSPDGKELASASDDKTVKLWDAHSGQLKQTLKWHSSTVNAVAYSPDGKELVSASEDGTVKLWNHNQFTTLKLFYDFDPKQVSDALKFLWEMGLDKEEFEFVHQVRTPTLYPKQGYYYEDVQFLPLLDMPKEDESKMDQLVRFLEERCAYKDKTRAVECQNKKQKVKP
jgi:hypothetical protein